MKKFFTIIFSRIVYTALFIIVQAAALFLVLRYFREKFVFFYAACAILSMLAALRVISSDINPAYKIAWLIPIMLLPIFGGLMYVMFGKTRMSRREKRRMAQIEESYRRAMSGGADSTGELERQIPDAGMHARYISNTTGVKPCGHTATSYLPIGEQYFETLKEELEKAERFIFMEYFIIEEGVMWDSVLEILRRKAGQGVDVRVMYDDLGCLFKLPQLYDRRLERSGIKACVFNRFKSILNARFNTRDHRKICVIDGKVGFTGGVNLADEYINVFAKHGHWKDAGVMLRGEGVWSLTVMFLSVWDYLRQEQDDFDLYAPPADFINDIADDGYVQPYSDTPLDDEPVGETVYINLINRARSYVYITTPYLIIDNEMLTALRTSARSGVEIRLMVPGRSDNRFVDVLTRSYYEQLLRAGVHIYEYTPGFVHAKNFISDDEYAVVGTINLDYRSLYLHYECAVMMYGCRAVAQTREDFLSTQEKCSEITLDSLKHKNFFQRLFLAVMRAFAPMM